MLIEGTLFGVPFLLHYKGVNGMDNATAQEIAIKVRALRHCNKLLRTIDEKGCVDLHLCNTGVTIHVVRDDINHMNLKVTQAELSRAIAAYEIVHRANEHSYQRVIPPAPVAAAPASTTTEEERIAILKARKREANKRYYEKHKGKKKNQ